VDKKEFFIIFYFLSADEKEFLVRVIMISSSVKIKEKRTKVS